MLIPAAPEVEEQQEDGYGFHLLEHLSRKGWSAVVTANGLGGVIVTVVREEDGVVVEHSTSGPSVDYCAGRLFREAMGFRSFAA